MTIRDVALARAMFAMLGEVFDEPPADLSARYIESLLSRPDFYAIASMHEGAVVGGLVAHALPMTRSEMSELFIYDLAVRPDHQRRGLGRALVRYVRELAAAAGIADSFVPADDEDEHALEFYRAIGGTASAVTHFTFSTPSAAR